MQTANKNQNIDLYTLIIIFIANFLIYFSYFLNDSVLTRDDIILIIPIKQIGSLNDYVNALMNNSIKDFQPLRDFSFYINFLIFKYTGISTFHLFNFLIFYSNIILAFFILKKIIVDNSLLIFFLLMFSFHPVLVSSVGWISARKHSLSLLFLLLFLYDYFKRDKVISLKGSLFFFLSMLSHQLFILLPFWIFLKMGPNRFSRNNILKIILFSILPFIVFLIASYKTFFLKMGNNTFIAYSSFEILSRYILSIGRTTVLIFFPTHISATYDQGNIINLLGLPLFVFFLYLCFKSKNRKICFYWIFAASLVHIPTILFFINDSYLYFSLFSIIVATYFCLTGFDINYHNLRIKFLSLFYILFLFLKTIDCSKMWRSDKDLWQYSYEQEKSPYTSILLGINLVKYNENLGLHFLIEGAKSYDILSHEAIFLSFLYTVYNSKLSFDDKYRVYKECYVNNPIYDAFLGLVYVQKSSFVPEVAIRYLSPIMKRKKSFQNNSIGDSLVKIVSDICKSDAKYYFLCTEYKISF